MNSEQLSHTIYRDHDLQGRTAAFWLRQETQDDHAEGFEVLLRLMLIVCVGAAMLTCGGWTHGSVSATNTDAAQCVPAAQPARVAVMPESSAQTAQACDSLADAETVYAAHALRPRAPRCGHRRQTGFYPGGRNRRHGRGPAREVRPGAPPPPLAADGRGGAGDRCAHGRSRAAQTRRAGHRPCQRLGRHRAPRADDPPGARPRHAGARGHYLDRRPHRRPRRAHRDSARRDGHARFHDPYSLQPGRAAGRRRCRRRRHRRAGQARQLARATGRHLARTPERLCQGPGRQRHGGGTGGGQRKARQAGTHRPGGIQKSQIVAKELAAVLDIERQRVDFTRQSVEPQIAVAQGDVNTARATAALRHGELDALRVRAGMAGVLQQVPVEVGQRVTAGNNLARVADPTKLKAQVKIPETQARDIVAGLAASVDTRNGVAEGKVSRVNPAVTEGTVLVDVTFDGQTLPKGARPDLSVEGTVELERIADTLVVGRPAFGREDSEQTLFRLTADGAGAERVKVRLGRGSVGTVEVREGLRAGDRVILSDTSAYDSAELIRLN